ncbi:MAG: protein kinase [Deltaproteobacteria bacterium]|nr:protein kinase [Deltaproteobacteria bacterium]
MRDFYYFSPERYDPGKAVNVRSDIYSLGLVFYEMFAGRRPFDAVETSRVMFCHLNEIPEPISIYAKKIPSDVSTAISRALEKDPDHRFNDFREFKQALGLASLIDSEGTVPDDDDDMTLALGRPQDEDENKRELFERDSARPSTRHTYGHAAVGDKLGDYEILSSLGKGGFGNVWKARSWDDKPVAVKVLNPQVLENEKVVRKFFHEASILSMLDHPNICRFIEFFPDGNNYCLAMEFIEGDELKKIIQQQEDPIPIDQAYEIAMQTLDVFQYMYEHGILYRDICPANIMIDRDGIPKIFDFSIGKLPQTVSHDTASSMLRIHYCPPERFDPKRVVDVRSDIYSLGLVFYEMFTGRRPFNATETSQIMFCHLNEIPEPPSSWGGGLSPDIDKAILKALEKDPDDRFNDFMEFKKAIDPTGTYLPKTPRAIGPADAAPVLYVKNTTLMTSGEANDIDEEFIRSFADRITAQARSTGLPIGERIGDYEIVRNLGSGGFARVWQAHSSEGKTVAIKALNPQVLENEKVVRKFFHEASILSMLDHPNICRFIEFFPDGYRYCLAMEYIDGVSLKEVVKEYAKPLPMEFAYRIAGQLLGAFQYAYEKRVLHRDINPTNILIDKNRDAKITDFIIGKLPRTASHDTAASMLTVHYVPPERFDPSKEVDVRSDIYSLGLVFYEMFAGRRPFNATETSQIMFCHLNEIPDPPSVYANEIPPDVSDAISRALEKYPDDRFNNFDEFAEAMGFSRADPENENGTDNKNTPFSSDPISPADAKPKTKYREKLMERIRRLRSK